MAPNKLQNGAQCCFSNFDSRLFDSRLFPGYAKLLEKAVSILLLSFNLSHFHKYSSNFLQEIYFLVFHIPGKWPVMNTDLDLNLAAF